MDEEVEKKSRFAYNYYRAAIALSRLNPDKEDAKERAYGYLHDALLDGDLSASAYVKLAAFALLDE